MKKTAAWIALGLVLAGSIAACAENPKATGECKDKASADDCDKCCHANGASGYKYMSNCACLGGG